MAQARAGLISLSGRKASDSSISQPGPCVAWSVAFSSASNEVSKGTLIIGYDMLRHQSPLSLVEQNKQEAGLWPFSKCS